MALINGTDFSGSTKPSSIENEVFQKELSALRLTEIPSGLQMRLDYGSRTDGQPDYQGYSAAGLGEGTDGWLIYKFTYDVNNMMTDRDVAGVNEDANWTARATYFA